MSTITNYMCNLCFKPVYTNGYTICYMPDSKAKGTYHLSSIQLGLFEMQNEISAGGAMISHICENCVKNIHSTVQESKSTILIK